jgi:hypothetical protein
LWRIVWEVWSVRRHAYEIPEAPHTNRSVQALISSRHSPETQIKQISACIRGIIFMGVPHGGTQALATWAKLLAISLNLGIVKKANTGILEVLKADSQVLHRIQDQFHDILKNRKQWNEPEIQIACYFEELPLMDLGFVSLIKVSRVS